MYTSLDGARRTGAAPPQQGEGSSSRLRRFGLAVLAFVFLIWLVTRGGGEERDSPSRSYSTVTARGGDKPRQQDEDFPEINAEEEEDGGASKQEVPRTSSPKKSPSPQQPNKQADEEPDVYGDDKDEDTPNVKGKTSSGEGVDDSYGDSYGETNFDEDEDSGDDYYEEDSKQKSTVKTASPTLRKATPLKPSSETRTESPTESELEAESTDDGADNDDSDDANDDEQEVNEQPEDDNAKKPIATTKKETSTLPPPVEPTTCEGLVRTDLTPKAKRLHFIDIPKAGGSGIVPALRDWGKRRRPRLRVYRAPDNVTDCPKAALTSTIIVGRGYGYCAEIEAGSLFTLAVLRAPLQRLVALFDSANQTVFKQDQQRLAVSTYGRLFFADLVHAYNATEEVEPGEKIIRGWATEQSKYLCGWECTGQKPTITEPTEVLHRARENLKRTQAVGLAEELNKLIPQVSLIVTENSVSSTGAMTNSSHSSTSSFSMSFLRRSAPLSKKRSTCPRAFSMKRRRRF